MSTLFVVDDNEIDSLIVKLNLKKNQTFDFVLYFNSGFDLIAYIKNHQGDYHNLPDMILLDLWMEGYDGWQVLAELKKLYPALSKKSEVVILSASISSIDIAKAEEYSFVKRFISKPFTKHTLLPIPEDTLT